MKPETEVKMKYGGWGLVRGAAAAMIVGFTWGGWTTRGKPPADDRCGGPDTRVAICVAQFTKGSDQQRLKEFKAINSWDRAAYIKRAAGTRCRGKRKPATP